MCLAPIDSKYTQINGSGWHLKKQITFSCLLIRNGYCFPTPTPTVGPGGRKPSQHLDGFWFPNECRPLTYWWNYRLNLGWWWRAGYILLETMEASTIRISRRNLLQTSQNSLIRMRFNKKHNLCRKKKAKVIHKGAFAPVIEREEVARKIGRCLHGRMGVWMFGGWMHGWFEGKAGSKINGCVERQIGLLERASEFSVELGLLNHMQQNILFSHLNYCLLKYSLQLRLDLRLHQIFKGEFIFSMLQTFKELIAL